MPLTNFRSEHSEKKTVSVAGLIHFGGLVLVLFAAPLGVSGATGDASACDRAALLAAKSVGTPFDVLRAVSRTETGRPSASGQQPWPWTVNMEGAGKWFADLESARSFVFRHFKEGARSFDVGCFQINYRWHNQAFQSIDQMFDPETNAKYAAQYLKELHQEYGDWRSAVGAYHSRTAVHAKKYVARYDQILANLPQDPVSNSASPQSQNTNLLAIRRGSLTEDLSEPNRQRSPGSLVPMPTTAKDGTYLSFLRGDE